MRRTHLILAMVGLITVIAWTIALGMLAHATGSGPHQWADWGAAGVGMALMLLVVLGGGCWLDSVLKHRDQPRDRSTVAARRMVRSRTGRTRSKPGPVSGERISADTEQRLRNDADDWIADAAAEPPADDSPKLVRPRHAATLRLEDEAAATVSP